MVEFKLLLEKKFGLSDLENIEIIREMACYGITIIKIRGMPIAVESKYLIK